MSAWQWGLAGFALLLLLYALRLILSGEGERQGQRRGLGCGFGLVATAIWTWVLSDWLGDGWDALRLALGLVLVLPVIEGLVRPGRVGLLRAGVSFVLAAVLVGPVLPRVWSRVRPTEEERVLAEAEGVADELQARLAAAEQRVQRLTAEREALSLRVRASGHEDFASLANDPQALEDLRELAELDAAIVEHEGLAAQLRARVPELESALRRLRRYVEERRASGAPVDEGEVDAILAGEARDPLPERPVTVEEHLEWQRLEELFERER